MSWWRRLSSSSSEDVLKTSSRSVDQNKYICRSHASSEDFLKTSSRRLCQDQYIRLSHTSSRRLAKVSSRRLAKASARHLQDVFKTSWTSSRLLLNMSSRHLQDVFNTYHQVKLFLLTRIWEMCNTFLRHTGKMIIYKGICLGHTSKKFMVSVQTLQAW